MKFLEKEVSGKVFEAIIRQFLCEMERMKEGMRDTR